MAGRWDQPEIPHRGWQCVQVDDVRGDGTPAEKTEYFTCEMCGQEKVRYVHWMEHPSLSEVLGVGRICASKMGDDYEGPRRREQGLRNRAAKRAKWLNRKWNRSTKGNPYLKVAGKVVVIFPAKFETGRWNYSIEREFSDRSFGTVDEAKLAVFDACFPASVRIVESNYDGI